MSVTSILPYQTVVTPVSSPSIATTEVVFPIPIQSGTSLALERIVFWDTGGRAVKGGDQINVTVYAGDLLGSTFSIVFADHSFIAAGVIGTLINSLNPSPEGGLVYQPPLRISASAGPCFIIYHDIGEGGGQLPGGMTAFLYGWQITSDDLTRDYPPPHGSRVMLA